MEETRILVVDDEQEIADLLELYLISDGYQVIKSEDALEGLAIMEREKIDLVLLDIMMPKMDGLEMCRKIREKHNVPIIMVSAKTQELDKIVGLTTGADDYVTKPFNPLELMARVKSQLRRYRDLNPANEKKGAEDSTIPDWSLYGTIINAGAYTAVDKAETAEGRPVADRKSVV